MKTPILETTRLQLRPFQKEDAQEVFDSHELIDIDPQSLVAGAFNLWVIPLATLFIL